MSIRRWLHGIYNKLCSRYGWEPPGWWRWWWQRRIRGWDDREIWDLHIEIARFALPRLEWYRATVTGYPGEFSEECGSGGGMDAWLAILDKMILAFTLLVAEYDGEIGFIESEDAINEGVALFGKYFRTLWD